MALVSARTRDESTAYPVRRACHATARSMPAMGAMTARRAWGWRERLLLRVRGIPSLKALVQFRPRLRSSVEVVELRH